MNVKSLKDIFSQAQFDTHHHEKLTSRLLDQYQHANVDSEEYCEEFIHYLKYVMVESRPEPTVERLVRFIAKVVAKAGNEESLQTFFESIIDFLLKSHEANDKSVRYRACQIIALIIDMLGDAELDDDICDRIFHAMHTRLSDKLASVRVHAIRALSRLQDPSDKHCPIVKAFLFLMSSDPNWQVRVECLKCVAPTKRSLLGMIERTRDVNEMIRKTAYHIIAEKVSVKALSISQRLGLLENGLADRSVQVQKACTDKLLQAWLVHYQANILDLLCGLDIMSSGEICEKSINLIVSKVSIEEILEGFDLLDEKRLIVKERLSCESVFYYRVLLAYVNKLGESSVEIMERITPDAKNFIEYITRVSATRTSDDSEYEEKATTEYLIQQLVQCIKYIDVSDPVSRKSVLGLCKDLLSRDDLSLSLTPQLMQCMQQVLKAPSDRMAEVATIISDIQEPNVMEEMPIDPDTLHQLKYKLAKVNMNLNELMDMMTEAVGKQDFATAAEIKEKIGLLEESKRALTEEMIPKPVVVPSQTRTDMATTLKCLTIFVELMTCSDMATMTDIVRSHMEELVIPAIPHNSPAVRKQAIKALGLCSLCDQEVARKFLPVFLQICRLDEEAVRLASLEALFDIILIHGIECFQETDSKSRDPQMNSEQALEGNSSISDSGQDAGDEDKENRNTSPEDIVFNEQEADSKEEVSCESSVDSELVYRSVNDLIQMFVDCLDDESASVRTLCAEGLAKLLLTARIVSSKLLSRLIILWYNPITEDDVKLRHCLGVFLPAYAFASRANQIQVEEVFIPTLQVIFDAPNTSPISSIDEQNVMELLLQLTSHRQVKQSDDNSNAMSAMTSHDSLAVKICNEMIERDNMYGVLSLSKSLTMLDLSMDNEILAKDLRNLCAQLTEVVKDRGSLKNIDKFRAKVGLMKLADTTITTSEGATELETEATLQENGNAEEEDEEEEINSTVLDTTSLVTSKLKRAAASKARSQLMSTLTDDTEDSSENEKSPREKTSGRRIKTKVPRLQEDSD